MDEAIDLCYDLATDLATDLIGSGYISASLLSSTAILDTDGTYIVDPENTDSAIIQ